MVIMEERPLMNVEVSSLVGSTENGITVQKFLKDFKGISLDKANKMKEEILKLEILKLKESHIVKIVDFMPINSSELSKVLSDVSLDSGETTKILEVVGRY